MHASPDTLGSKSATRTSATLHLVAAGIGRWVWWLAAAEWIAAFAIPRATLAGAAVYPPLLAFVVVNIALQLMLQRALATQHALYRLRVPGIRLSRGAWLIAFPAVLLAGPAAILLLRQPGASALTVAGIVVSWVTVSAALVLLPRRSNALLMPLLIVPLFNLGAGWLSGTLAWTAAVLGAGLALWSWRALWLEDPPAHAYGSIVAAPVLHGLAFTSAQRTRIAVFLGDLHRLCTPWRRLQQGYNGPYDLRAWLGRPFLPRPWWKHVFGATWGLAVLAVLLALAARMHWSAGASGMLVGVVGLGVWMIGSRGQGRLQDGFHRIQGEVAELALLPGLGTPRQQRAALHRYALRQPLLRGALALSAALLGSAVAGAPFAVCVSIAAWGTLALEFSQVMLRMGIHPTLAPARWMHNAWLRALWLLAWLLAIATMVALSAQWLGPASDAGRTSAHIVLTLLWLGALAAMAWPIARHARHARRLPHPFVQR